MTADVLHVRGLEQWRSGDYLKALQSIGHAITLMPSIAIYRNSFGIVLASMGQPVVAIAAFRAALTLAPADPAAWSNLGNALRTKATSGMVIRTYARALSTDPSSTTTRANLASFLREIGAHDAARRLHRQSVAIMPSFAEGWRNLGVVRNQTDVAPSLAALNRAMVLSPDPTEVHNDRGIILFGQNQIVQALASFDSALHLNPFHVEALINGALALQRLNQNEEARARYSRALSLHPAQAEALSNLAGLDETEFDHHRAISRHRRALAVKPSAAALHSSLLFALCTADSVTNDELFAECRRWESAHARPKYSSITPASVTPDPDRRLRIGWSSADFIDHPVARNIVGLIERRDREAFTSIIYADTKAADAMTARLRHAADEWQEIGALSDTAAADRIRADRIDILIILAGHTLNNRIGIAARKPAPIQLSLYDLTSSGIEVMDGWLTDPVLHPTSTTELFTEQLIRLPCLYLHEPPAGAPAPGPSPRSTAEKIVFGSLNNPRKYNATVFAAWARILLAVPGSRLLLKYLNAFESPRLQNRVLAAFSKNGVSADRIIFESRHSARNEHLTLLQRIDIALDPFPFNGSTTTFEALWMGVPLVTLAGARFVSRVGASALTQIGLTDLIAEDIDGYIDRAVRLASDIPQLASLRRTLRDRLAASPLCDADTHARALESVLRQVWRTWCTNRPS